MGKKSKALKDDDIKWQNKNRTLLEIGVVLFATSQ